MDVKQAVTWLKAWVEAGFVPQKSVAFVSRGVPDRYRLVSLNGSGQLPDTVFGGVINVPGLAGNGDYGINVGGLRTGNGYAYLDLVGNTGADYNLRLIRGNSGADASSAIIHTGAGELNLNAINTGTIALKTASNDRLTVSAAGTVDVVGLLTAGDITIDDDLIVGDDADVVGSLTAGTIATDEAGTWTPVPSFGGNNVGMVYTSAGYYQRIGKYCTIICGFQITTEGSSTGALTVTGLPFTAQNTTFQPSVACRSVGQTLASVDTIARVNANATTISINYRQSAGAVGAITQAHIGPTTTIEFTLTYITT